MGKMIEPERETMKPRVVTFTKKCQLLQALAIKCGIITARVGGKENMNMI